MNVRNNLETLDALVEDIIENMGEEDKAFVKETSEDNLIVFHHGWGTVIRNHYNLHHNDTLVNDLGANDPDEASMIIIRAVWRVLRGSGKEVLEKT